MGVQPFPQIRNLEIRFPCPNIKLLFVWTEGSFPNTKLTCQSPSPALHSSNLHHLVSFSFLFFFKFIVFAVKRKTYTPPKGTCRYGPYLLLSHHLSPHLHSLYNIYTNLHSLSQICLFLSCYMTECSFPWMPIIFQFKCHFLYQAPLYSSFR